MPQIWVHLSDDDAEQYEKDNGRPFHGFRYNTPYVPVVGDRIVDLPTGTGMRVAERTWDLNGDRFGSTVIESVRLRVEVE